jgi:predicted nuclease of predicted toxin-antitoxin system
VILLFDENLSPRLVGDLASHWPDSTHIELLGMRGASDAAIWAHARDGNFIIVSKDDDFRSLALVLGPPPKVIWLQVGNASRAAVANLLRANALLLKTFSLDPADSRVAILAVGADGLTRQVES